MASMGGGPLSVEPVLRLVMSRGMLNKNLQEICKSEGIRHTNLKKADLQHNIEERLNLYAQAGNVEKFRALEGVIRDQSGAHSGSAAAHGYGGSPHAHIGGAAMPPRPSYQSPFGIAIKFEESPFYKIREQVGMTRICDPMQAHRNNIELKIRFSDHPALQTIEHESSLKVMVYCAGETKGIQQISFPHQSEIKVNGDDVKANLRGLKNKPGTTRPADITKLLRQRPPTYENKVEFTYALTNKAGSKDSQKFYVLINLVQTVAVEDLKKEVEGRYKLSKESIVREMVAKAADPDIEVGSTVLSLKCPLSTLRMQTPVRGTTCRHNQCFDVTSYLQLQEQAPTWLCPICNNPAPFKSLAVDEYVLDILNNTPKSLEQITIEPDGKWSKEPKAASVTPTTNGNGKRKREFIDSDDDLIEISDFDGSRPPPALRQPSLSNGFTADTPPVSIGGSREPSHSTPRAAKAASMTIDLTGDSDDDEPVVRQPKRQSMSNGIISTSYLPLPTPNEYGNGSYSM